ncbi:type II DNA topoisomerase [Jaminaea rosea]|uniref:DNA topoisomerase 2 n=1 Tax=Jaminaea rosea TaxID=1569628 RepID=A0A316UL71_9BASI|nr:type II DNA topoisomerase [Jaminaea rosea]PWN25684.1 type II DNA topoisomerase [Jaminaea rosea]
MSSDVESSFHDNAGSDSDDYIPAPAKKATKAAPSAAKKAAAAPKKAPTAKKASASASASASTSKAPLKKRKSNEGEDGDADGDHSMSLIEAVEGRGAEKKTTANGTAKSASETYQKLSQLEHVLLRPDTYIGSVEHHTDSLWVYDAASQKMAFREISYVPGFYKIFDEILVNAADNKVRDPTMDTIKVTINKAEGSITVWNNGRGIPIEIHEKEGIYIPELIFGNLLTSSNYDDAEDKVTGGRNGYGAKLANIYSTEFTVETADRKSEQKYKQTFRANMSVKEKPKITKNAGGKQEYTSITFKPDLPRFKMEAISDDMEALMMKRVYDMAGTVKDVKVHLNGERLKVKGFKQYVEMYVSALNELTGGAKVDENGDVVEAVPAKQTIVYDSHVDKGKTWEVAFAVSDGQARQVSFVNNIATIQGGRHVEVIEKAIVDKIVENLTKNKKNGPVKTTQVRQQLWLFVNCQIVNPTFDGQTKEKMTLKPSAFGSKWTLSEEFARKIMKSGVVDNVLSFAKFQQEKQLKTTDGHKRQRITGITKLEDANNAGTRKGRECTLILTEGDSAKALAVSGLTEVGRDNYGVFPLRGKLLNVREAGHDAIMKNVEITNIKTIMGLQHGKTYQSVDSLRYGRLMIMTDQDYDGSHIKGLIINFLDHFFPSLLKLPNFLIEFITPIVKCTKGKQEKSFFTIPEYERWKEENRDGKGWVIKYFKGLGTSTAQDAKRYFRAMGTHMLPFETTQEGDRELIDLAFNKKKADDRKEWLRNFKPGTYLDHNIDKVPLSDFINKELILFSMADNVRSIPSMVDGLKPGQRKVMFGCFKRKLKNEIKVVQLAGYVSEHSAYHHGDTSLTQTIVGLAQDYVGSNNVNLLLPNGQFGTRGMGGKDAASARYIFTALPSITRTIFHPSDDALLTYLNDDGQSIEPEWYMPTLPMVLVNGGEGIGTGWSSFVPNYNPLDIVANLQRRLRGEDMVAMKPWYRGFTGPIEEQGPGRYKVSGIINQIDDSTWEITELPVRTWTSSYKEALEERVVGSDKVVPTLKEYKEYHTDTTVHFQVKLTEKGMREISEKGAEAFFKISTQISTSNMVLFDAAGKIKKYSTPEEILDDFYMLRLGHYQRRKEHLVEELKTVYERLSNQARFVQMIVAKTLVVNNRKRVELVEELRKKDFRPFPRTKRAKVAGEVNADEDDVLDEGEDDTPGTTDFDYLLSMPIYNLTKEKVDRLLAQRDERERELSALLGRTPQNLWEQDLHEFVEEWEKLLAEDERRLKDVARKTGGKKAAKKTGAAARKVIKGSDDEMFDDDSDDDFKPAPAAKAKAAAPKRTASAALDDDDAILAGPSKKAAPKKAPAKKPTTTSQSKLPFKSEAAADDSDDYIVAAAAAAPSKPKAKPRAASTSRKPAKKAEDEDEDASMIDLGSDVDAESPKPRAKAASRAAASAKKSYKFADSDEDDDSFNL